MIGLQPQPMDTVADLKRTRVPLPHGNWNMHGTHRCAFVETTVTGVDLGCGF